MKRLFLVLACTILFPLFSFSQATFQQVKYLMNKRLSLINITLTNLNWKFGGELKTDTLYGKSYLWDFNGDKPANSEKYTAGFITAWIIDGTALAIRYEFYKTSTYTYLLNEIAKTATSQSDASMIEGALTTYYYSKSYVYILSSKADEDGHSGFALEIQNSRK